MRGVAGVEEMAGMTGVEEMAETLDLVEVLVATYNGERFLGEQLNSILSQTCDRFRILISDDGSEDGTLGIIEEFAANHPDKVEIAAFDRPSNSPQGNFFRLISRAKGEYVMLCDQDDVWIPEKIRLTLERMKEMEEHYGKQTPILVHGDLAVVDESLSVIHPSMRVYQKIRPDHRELRHYLVENNITGNTVMINEALRKLVKGTMPTCYMHDWWLGLTASSFGQISYINKPLTLYRQHGNNQLGAEEGGLFREIKKRQSMEIPVREAYRRMFAQAECFLTTYEERLGPEQKRLLVSFIEIPKLGKSGRIRTVIQLRLWKSTWIRTVGQMWSIG